jgi:O-antigen/teichoic acid export membrane protein
MLNKLSKLSYKFSTNAIFIFYSIMGDLLLNQEDFGKFSIIMALEILIFNLSDFFNTKYLLGKFSTHGKNEIFKKIFTIKLSIGLLSVIILSTLFFFYNISWQLILLLLSINYIQILSSTMATYIFANKKGIQLLLANTIGFIFGMSTVLSYYLIYSKVNIDILLISMLLYRIGEIIVLYKYHTFTLNVKIKPILPNIKEAFPFYIQLVISMASAKLFMLFLPSLISYSNISIIATYEYIVAIPLFIISVFTMSTYSQLFHLKLDIKFKPDTYDMTIKNYYKKAIFTSIFFMVLQIIYIYTVKPTLIPYLPYLLIQDITIVFSAMQGYLLFFWKLHNIYIMLTIVLFIVKNTIMLYLINIYGIVAYFWITVILEIFILTYIQIIVYRKKSIMKVMTYE